MAPDVLLVLQSIIERLDAQIPRLDALDVGLRRVGDEACAAREEARAAREEARAAREETQHLGRQIAAQGQQLHALSEGVAVIAGIQADVSKQLGMVNERLGRLIEGNIRGRTEEAERYASLETRVTELEQQLRALTAERGR